MPDIQTNDFSVFSDGTNDYHVKDATAREHIASPVLGSTGVHGLRYHENKLYYKDSEVWNEIRTGGGAVQLTQEQYDALSQEEKNADVIYVITDSDIVPADNSRVVKMEKSVLTVDPLENTTTTFNANGSITSVKNGVTINTVFNPNGSITETYTYSDGTVKIKNVTFTDSVITETISDSAVSEEP